MSTSHSGKWIRSFVCGYIAAACLVLGASADGLAQVSVGIKTGVPLTGVFYSSGFTYWQGSSFGSQAQTQHYAIGPMVDVRLPGQYDLEVGVMYKRVEQHAPNVTLLGFTCVSEEDCRGNFQTHDVSRVGRSWEFPVAMRYHFSSPSLWPYVEGGFSYNHLTDIFISAAVPYNSLARVPQPVLGPAPVNIDRSGFLLGAGVEMKLPLVRLTPGVRYARYEPAQKFFPPPAVPGSYVFRTPADRRDAVDFMMGINLNSKSLR